MSMRNSAGKRFLIGMVLASATVALLAGCTSAAPAAAPSDTATPTPTISNPEETPAPLALKPEGTALQNIEFFDSVMSPFLTDTPDTGGREIIDHLVAAGFDKSQMELTPDTTAVGLEADNIQFSVRMNNTCLVGQSGNVGYHSLAAPILSTGTCLVGNTRAIDW
jgi:hypothetical protein